MREFGRVQKRIAQSAKQTENEIASIPWHLVISALTGSVVLLWRLSDRQVFIRQSTTHSLFSAVVQWQKTNTNLDRKPTHPPPCQHVYLHCFLCSLPSLPFCHSCVFSRLTELNPVDLCDEWAALFCWAWTRSAQRKAPAYLCNEKYELCLKALSICHTWDIALMLCGNFLRKQEFDGEEAFVNHFQYKQLVLGNMAYK